MNERVEATVADEVCIVDPCTSEEWSRLIHDHPDAGIFHHPAWMKMLRDIYGYRFFAVCLKRDNALYAGIPVADVRSRITGRRWVSLPFSDHCRPLVPPDDSAATDRLVGYLKAQQGSATPRIELRWDIASSHSLYRTSDFVSHLLEFAGNNKATLFKMFNQQAQRSIRKSEKEGVVVKACTTYAEFELFYRLQVMTRRRLGVPAQPRLFFRGVWDYLIMPGFGIALLAFKDDTPIGGGVFFKFKDTMVYKYGASDLKYKAYQPNYAYMWSGIQRALDDGCVRFDFGRSDKRNDGLRRFKLGWGTQEHELAYTVLADREPAFGPSKLEGIVGTVIRNSPEIVCKLSGELLYKHFA